MMACCWLTCAGTRRHRRTEVHLLSSLLESAVCALGRVVCSEAATTAWALQRPNGFKRRKAFFWSNLLGAPCPRVVDNALKAKAMPTQGPPELRPLPTHRAPFGFGGVLLLGCRLLNTREAPVAPRGAKHAVIRVCFSLGRCIIMHIRVFLGGLHYRLTLSWRHHWQCRRHPSRLLAVRRDGIVVWRPGSQGFPHALAGISTSSADAGRLPGQAANAKSCKQETSGCPQRPA